MTSMGFRVIILAAMGLAALYMLHLLAQDYNKIRQPVRAVARALFRFKRHVEIPEERKRIAGTGREINWEKILRQDPLRCLQSLICQIVSGSEPDNIEARNIRAFVEFSYQSAPEEIVSAYNLGFIFQNRTGMCFDEYPFCFYSARTMLMVLKWFTNNVV